MRWNHNYDPIESLKDPTCTADQAKNLPQDVMFSKISGDLDRVVGISTKGVLIYKSATDNGEDPVYPLSDYKENKDDNLFYSTSKGQIFQYTVSPGVDSPGPFYGDV